MFERMCKVWDEEDLENNYNYDVEPSCHSYIYREYEKKHNLTGLTLKDYKKLEEEFFVFKDILFKLFSVLDIYEYFEQKYKYISLSIYGFTLTCWTLILVVSVLNFPPDFEYTLEYLYTVLKYLELEEPYC